MDMRLLFIVLGAFVAGGIVAMPLMFSTPQSASRSSVGGPFALTTHEGKRVTEKYFQGRYMLVAFGYTYCPDICPSELQTIALTLDALGPKADGIVPVFISVDPERDSVAQLAGYVKNFSPRIVGLTGTPEEVKAAATVYRAAYKKEPAPNGADYAVSHTTFMYVMGPDGTYVTHFNYGTSAEDMTAKLKKILGD
jgi:cytochrome oxidase Cu insertion factor (SCO1/SenC/PrrC family)